MLVGVEAPFEVRLHLATEGVEGKLEGARGEDLAGADAGDGQRQELAHEGIQLALEVGGGDRAVDQPVALGGARLDRLTEQDQLARAPAMRAPVWARSRTPSASPALSTSGRSSVTRASGPSTARRMVLTGARRSAQRRGEDAPPYT